LDFGGRNIQGIYFHFRRVLGALFGAKCSLGEAEHMDRIMMARNC
jgi:hypothetical protein